MSSCFILIPTEIPSLADSARAASTISFRCMTFGPRLTALQVIRTFGLQSTIRCARDSAENPAKTTYNDRKLIELTTQDLDQQRQGTRKVKSRRNLMIKSIKYRVDGANTSTSKHCHWKFHQHR